MNDPLSIGLFCIVIAAQSFSRFHTPPSNRSTTTALRYYTAAVLYCLFYVTVFFLLTEYPAVIEPMAQVAGISLSDIAVLQRGSTQSVTIALALGTVIPKAPLIRDLDEAIRRYLQDRALIGYQAQVLGGRLADSKLEVPRPIENAVADRLRSLGIDPPAVPDHSIADLWRRIVSLMTSFEAFDHNQSFAPFKVERRVEFSTIAGRFAHLEEMANTLFLRLRPALEANDPRIGSLVTSYERSFVKESDNLYRSMCNLASQAVLSQGLTEKRRSTLVSSLGFEPDVIVNDTKDFMAAMFLAMLVTTVGVNLLLAPEDAGLWTTTKRALVVVFSAVISIASAWFIRVSHGHPPERGSFPPVFSYLLAGFVAVVAFTPVRIGLRAWMESISFSEMASEMFTGLEREWSLPLITFATAGGLAWCLDNRGDGKLRGLWLSAVEACSLSVLLVGTAIVVDLIRNDATTYYAQSTALLVVAGVQGALIGGLVPGWRRSPARQRKTDIIRTLGTARSGTHEPVTHGAPAATGAAGAR